MTMNKIFIVSKDFIKTSNDKVITKEFLEECKKSSSIFKKK